MLAIKIVALQRSGVTSHGRILLSSGEALQNWLQTTGEASDIH
jgi:hypothetical protein